MFVNALHHPNSYDALILAHTKPSQQREVNCSLNAHLHATLLQLVKDPEDSMQMLLLCALLQLLRIREHVMQMLLLYTLC